VPDEFLSVSSMNQKQIVQFVEVGNDPVVRMK
jgi:hypothetical protein